MDGGERWVGPWGPGQELRGSDWSVTSFKLCALFTVVVISLAGSFLPLRLSSVSEKHRNAITVACRMFAAGVFLGVSLLHMLPEANNGLQQAGLSKLPDGREFPLAFSVAAIGFVVVWFIERQGQARWGLDGGRVLAVTAQAEKCGGGSICYVQVETVASYGPVVCAPMPVHSRERIASPSAAKNADSSNSLPLSKDYADVSGSCEEHGQVESGDAENHHLDCSPYAVVDAATPLVRAGSHHHHRQSYSTDGQNALGHSHDWGQMSEVQGGSNSDQCESLHKHKHGSQHHHVVLQGNGAMSYLLAGLLSLHSFVVGAALGSAHTLDGTLSLFIALVAHKGAEAFSVGLQFVREEVSVGKTVAVMLLYCAMTPLGIVAGMATLLVQGPAGVVLANLLQAFGAGTVLYVVMHQLGEQSAPSAAHGVGEGCLFLGGLLLMLAVSVFT